MIGGFAAFGYRVTLGEDFRKPACKVSAKHRNQDIQPYPYVKLISINVLQLHSNGALPRLQIVDVTHPVGREVGMTILLLW